MSSEQLPLFEKSTKYYGSAKETFVNIVPINERITYTWTDLNVFAQERDREENVFQRLKSKLGGQSSPQRQKHILKNGVAYPGELLAILGSSGSGKTTLLNALTFRSCSDVTVTGLRCANKIPITSTSLIKRSAYLQQDELFFPTLTVKEHLVFQALLRMDRGISKAERMKRVDEVISELSLVECMETQIGSPGSPSGGLSGGERRRLAFAAEVLTNPLLLVCDEPTSGLDASIALSVVQTLKTMAKLGKTVICTIHQPSSDLYAMFDKVLLMAEGGRTAFLGTPEDTAQFFNSVKAPCPRNYNPADYFIQLLAVVPEAEESCKSAITIICDNYDKSSYREKLNDEFIMPSKLDPVYTDFHVSIERDGRYKASRCTQFRVVLRRSLLTTLKEPKMIKVRILQTMLVAILIALLYYGQQMDQDGVLNVNGALFTFLTCMTFQNVYAVVHVFCADLPVFLREHKSGTYRTSVYFLSRTIAELPIFVVLPFLFTAICYHAIGLNSSDPGRFFITAGVVVLVANVATSYGYLISCISSNISMALSLGPPVIIPLLLFAGYFLNVKAIPPYFHWLSWLSWFRFGNEALLVNQWQGIDRINCTVRDRNQCPVSGEVVLRIYNFHEENLVLDVSMLVALIVLFRLLAFLCLLIRVKNREYASN